MIIPVWNRADLLQKLLDSIGQQRCAPREVIAVDNGSTDNAVNIASNWGARVVHMGRNAGFAAATNRGIQASATEWVALVNSDVELRPDWLSELLGAAISNGAWFGSGKILMSQDPRRIDGIFDLVAKSGCAWRAGYGQPEDSFPLEQRAGVMISATAAIYKRELFERVGLFAEIYESYLEDVDFSLRCAALGFRGVFAPCAVCVHQGSASSGKWSARNTFLLARNQRILVRRLFAPGLRRRYGWNILAGQLLWGLVAARHGQFLSWWRGRAAANRMDVVPAYLDSDSLAVILTAAEQEMAVLQKRTGADLYWRLYFSLTKSASK